MVKIKFSLAELYYLALLMKQKTILGFPNLFEILNEDQIQEQMDAAREMLLQRNILKKDGNGNFDVDSTVVNIMVCCCNTTQYIEFVREGKTIEDSCQITYYKVNENETLACSKSDEDFFYEFYLLQSSNDLKSDIIANIGDSFQTSPEIEYFAFAPETFANIVDGTFDISALDGDGDNIRKDFAKEFMANRTVYYFIRYKKNGEEWEEDRINLIGLENNLWILRNDEIDNDVKIVVVDEELGIKLFDGIIT